MEGRTICIKFDDYKSEEIVVESGLNQGCNLSCILYNYYSATQLGGYEGKKEKLGVGYADDAMCAVAGKGMNETARKLEEAFSREGGAKEWAKTHWLQYEYSKFGVVALSKKRKETVKNGKKRRKLEHRPTLTLGGRNINPNQSHKYLGVIIDQTLSFKDHTDYTTGKPARYMAQFKRLTKITKGMGGEYIRKMYRAVTLAFL
ncbi:hypothetical protein P691DRAFT_617294, partial [Macrolepiota fuliginosa MF-IS2]